MGQLAAAERAILAVCSPEPQTAKRIANKLGRQCNSYFRAQLTKLCRPRAGKILLQRTPDGYRVPDDSAPANA